MSKVGLTGLVFALLIATFGNQGIASGSASTASAAADSPQFKRGRLLYIQCRACHDLQPSSVRKVGPNLHGIMGRKAGFDPSFSYSSALEESNLVWDRKTLDRWIERPSALVKGNTMAFAGIANAADREALIAYIEIESAPKK